MIRFNLNVIIAQHEQDTGRRWSYTALAEATGLNKNTIGAIATNKSRRVDLDTLNALCNFFGCEPGALFEYIPPSQEESHTPADAGTSDN